MDKQTWEEEEQSVSKQELRSALLNMACRLNEEECVRRARAQFTRYAESNGTVRYVQRAIYLEWLGGGNAMESVSDIELSSVNWIVVDLEPKICFHLYVSCRIPGDLQQVVFTVAAQSDEGWEALLGMYAHATYDAEKRKMLRGLASTQDPRRIVW